MYNLSQDYERLWELIMAGETPVFLIDFDIAGYTSRGVTQHARVLKASPEKDQCFAYWRKIKLEWIDPQPAKRVFFIDEIRTWVNQLQAEEITIGKFIELLNEKALNKEANDALRSCYSIVQRKGADTNWEAIEKVLKSILHEQHKAISDPQPVAQEPQMNYEHLKEKLDAFFKDVEPEHLIDEFTKMGYEFKPAAGKWVPVFDPSAGGSGIVEVFQPAEEKKPFTMQDFEKGLMLAGLVQPANETEAKEKQLLEAYEKGRQSIIDKLKGLEGECECLTGSHWHLDYTHIETIINQSK